MTDSGGLAVDSAVLSSETGLAGDAAAEFEAYRSTRNGTVQLDTLTYKYGDPRSQAISGVEPYDGVSAAGLTSTHNMVAVGGDVDSTPFLSGSTGEDVLCLRSLPEVVVAGAVSVPLVAIGAAVDVAGVLASHMEITVGAGVVLGDTLGVIDVDLPWE